MAVTTADPHAAALDGVTRILKRRVVGVDLWRVWDGSPTADDPLPAGKTSARLTPLFEPEEAESSRAGRVTYRSPVLVRVEVRTPDPYKPDRALAIYSQILDALLDPAEGPALNAAGVSWAEPVQPPNPAAATDGAVSGAVRLVCFVTRP